MYDHLMAQDAFTPLSQRKTLIPSMIPKHFGGAGVDEAAAALD